MARPDTCELATALRQWRERLDPGDAGLPAGPRRRTPGLRREEVAQLARVSVDYVTRLEQNRAPQPSPTVLTALARALRLSTPETEHLYTLAGAPFPGPDRIREVVRPSVLRLLERIQDLPVTLPNARGDLLAWNDLAAALLGDLSVVAPERRTHLWLHFGAHDHFRSRLVTNSEDGPRLDRSAVAQARAALARYPDDERLRRTIRELRATSPRFAALWDERPIEYRRSDIKTYDVPGIGRITLDCEALEIADDDQILIVYSAAPGTPDAEKLDLLRVIGLQTMQPR